MEETAAENTADVLPVRAALIHLVLHFHFVWMVNCIQTVLEKSVRIFLLTMSFHSFRAHPISIPCSGILAFHALAWSWEYLTWKYMLLSVSNALILSQHSKHSKKSSLFAFGQKTFRSRSLLHQQIRTKGSFKILRIASMKLIDTGRSTTSYTLMKFSMESVKILLCSFPRSARMRATGGMQTVVLDTLW